MNAQHLSIDELADAAEGLLDPDRAAFVESHLAGCTECQANSDALREVTATLRADVSPPMPDAVAHRLSEVVAAESAHRAVVPALGRGNSPSSSTSLQWWPRSTAGTSVPRPARWNAPAGA
jgi:anti-sigma factor RsiW